MGDVSHRLLDTKVSPRVILVKLDQADHKLNQGNAIFLTWILHGRPLGM